jgi:hypothetical protein
MMQASTRLDRPWWRRSLYRLGQFRRGLCAQVTETERAQALCRLPPAAARLFCAMPRDAQRHSLDVYATLRAAGHTDPSLLAAALLHDVGKLAATQDGRRVGLWARGVLVLLHALAPRWCARYTDPDPASGLRYLLYVHRNHPAIGAAWAAQAGCDDLCCRLIAYHQMPPEHSPPGVWRALLGALQEADDAH